eukprot:126382-Prorocentrum_minimum.AAC.2
MPRDPKKKAAKKKARKQVPTCPCRNVRVIRVGFREVALEGDFCFTFVSTGDVRNRLLPSRGLQAKIAQNAAADEEEMEMEGDEEERPRPSGRRRRLLPWGNCNMFTTSHIAPFRLQKLVFARVHSCFKAFILVVDVSFVHRVGMATGHGRGNGWAYRAGVRSERVRLPACIPPGVAVP